VKKMKNDDVSSQMKGEGMKNDDVSSQEMKNDDVSSQNEE